MTIQFGAMRKYCSRIDRVSICMEETFRFIQEVPAKYDSFYLYGFEIIESEFPNEKGMDIKTCLEFMLSKEPRQDLA